jgi:hypothetical protein
LFPVKFFIFLLVFFVHRPRELFSVLLSRALYLASWIWGPAQRLERRPGFTRLCFDFRSFLREDLAARLDVCTNFRCCARHGPRFLLISFSCCALRPSALSWVCFSLRTFWSVLVFNLLRDGQVQSPLCFSAFPACFCARQFGLAARAERPGFDFLPAPSFHSLRKSRFLSLIFVGLGVVLMFSPALQVN